MALAWIFRRPDAGTVALRSMKPGITPGRPDSLTLAQAPSQAHCDWHCRSASAAITVPESLRTGTPARAEITVRVVVGHVYLHVNIAE